MNTPTDRELLLGGKLWCDESRGGCGGAWWVTIAQAKWHAQNYWPTDCPHGCGIELRFEPYDVQANIAAAQKAVLEERASAELPNRIWEEAVKLDPSLKRRPWYKRIFDL